MPVSSLSSSSLASAYLGSTDTLAAATAKKAEKADKPQSTIADHVAEADEQAPIRSANATQGTLVDTYL